MAKVPDFKFCGKFSGKTSAARWLKSFNHELECCKDETTGRVPPGKYLSYLDLLMTEDAADWAEENPDAAKHLATDAPTQDTVDNFLALFKERFPSKAIETTPITFDSELADLKQKQDEALATYYTRTINLMQKYGAKDRPQLTSGSTAAPKTLSLAEASLLDTFLRQWIKGLQDFTIKEKVAEGMGSNDRSLRKLYELADQVK